MFQGNGNIGTDPLFCDADGLDGIMGTLDDNLRLRDASLSRDTANDTQVPEDVSDIDEDGDPKEVLPWDLDSQIPYSHWGRFFNVISGPNTKVDMGAYENQHIAACKWDISSPGYMPPPDGNVGNPDFSMLIQDWGSCPGCGADFNCDLVVNTVDYNDLLANWGPCPAGGAPGGGGNSPQGGSGLTLEDALWSMGFLSLEDYQAWLDEATDEEAYNSAVVLAAILGGG